MTDKNQGAEGRFGRTESGGFAGQGSTPQAGNQPSRQRPPVSSTLESDYWRSNYQHRPYVEPGVSYDEYAPAYQYGWDAYSQNTSRLFEDVEPELRTRWDRDRGSSRLTWEKARHAARDAWDRMAGSASTSDQHLPLLKNLLQICVDGAQGFTLAAEKLSPQHAALFRKFGQERDQIASELRNEITRRSGEDTEKNGDVAGALHRGWINIKSALSSGEKAVIDEAERGEDHAVAAFQDALNNNSLPNDLEVLITRCYTKVKAAHDVVRDLQKQTP